MLRARRRFESPNTDFDVYYFPGTKEIKMLTKNEWSNIPIHKEPEWLGFNYENKPYKLEDRPNRNENLNIYDSSDEDDTVMSLHHMFYHPRDFGTMQTEVETVINPYIKRTFELKKAQSGSQIIIAFHATEPENVNSIIENNFNWRFSGRSTGFLYGKGVYFAEQAAFTHQFCTGPDKRIILSLVLYGGSCTGSQGLILPMSGCDTALSPDKQVLVKFEDSEFLPMLIFNYHNFFWDILNFF